MGRFFAFEPRNWREVVGAVLGALGFGVAAIVIDDSTLRVLMILAVVVNLVALGRAAYTAYKRHAL